MNEYQTALVVPVSINESIKSTPVSKKINSYPQYFEKFEKSIDIIKQKLYEQRKQTDIMMKELKYIEKTAIRMMEKDKKKYEKLAHGALEENNICGDPSITYKKKGFTKPVKISESLSKFMDMPKETMISRTDVTKFLMQYIKEKKLENPDNRRQIWPNDDLWELLGETARNEPILTHFNLQKYMNIHYIKMNE